MEEAAKRIAATSRADVWRLVVAVVDIVTDRLGFFKCMYVAECGVWNVYSYAHTSTAMKSFSLSCIVTDHILHSLHLQG